MTVEELREAHRKHPEPEYWNPSVTEEILENVNIKYGLSGSWELNFHRLDCTIFPTYNTVDEMNAELDKAAEKLVQLKLEDRKRKQEDYNTRWGAELMDDEAIFGDGLSEQFPYKVWFEYHIGSRYSKIYERFITEEQYQRLLKLETDLVVQCIKLGHPERFFPYDKKSYQQYLEDEEAKKEFAKMPKWKQKLYKHMALKNVSQMELINGQRNRSIILICTIMTNILLTIFTNKGWTIWIAYIPLRLYFIYRDMIVEIHKGGVRYK